MTTSWRKIERSDIKTFDDKSTDLVLRAMALEGVVGRLSSRGHCLLRTPGGETMSVSRRMNQSNRSSQNIEATWTRLFGGLEQEANELAAQEPARPAHVPTFQMPRPHPNYVHEMQECPVPTCHEKFPTTGGLYSHTRRDHAVCLECNPTQVLDGERELRMHNDEVHKEPEKAPETTANPLEVKPGVFKCPECDKEYPKARFLAAHRWKKHGVPGESSEAKRRAEKRAAEAHLPTDVECVFCTPHTWHKNNRLLGLHKWTAHQIPGASKQTPAKMHTTPPNVKADTRIAGRLIEETPTPEVAAQEAIEAPAKIDWSGEEVQGLTDAQVAAAEAPAKKAVAAKAYDNRVYRTVIQEIYNIIPEWFKADAAEVSRLQSVVEGLQEELGKAVRERDDLKARLDLLREAMGA